MTEITKVNNAAVVNVEYFSDDVINAFVASRHGSANSQRTYRNAVKALVKYFAAKSITAPTTADIDGFINELRAANRAASTQRLYMTVCKLFFSYLQKQGIYRDVAQDVEPLRIKKSTCHKRDALTQDQAQKLLAAIVGDDEKSLRDRAIVALALQCGLRTVEIERANVDDLTDAGGYYELVVQGKGCTSKDSEQVVKVAPQVAAMIFKYWAARGDKVKADSLYSSDAQLPMFTSTSRNQYGSKAARLSAQSIGKMIKSRLKAVGVDSKKITAHSTRHFAATCAIMAGVDLREVSAMLRHASLNVTMTYLHDLDKKNRRAELAVADTLFGGVVA